MSEKENILDIIRNKISEADAILITAGAGMGVDSGLPDFRGNEGFWKAYPIIKNLGISFSQMANPEWFENDPELAWAFYGHRYNLYKETIPHDGFTMLKDLIKRKKQNYFIYTSNVDGQFQKAGFDEEKIVEIHGSIHHFQCKNSCTNSIWESSIAKLDVDMQSFRALDIPKCKYCSTIARPNILMFGDWGWIEKRTAKQEDRFYSWLQEKQLHNEKIVIIELGAGLAVPTIRMQGEQIARKLNKAVLVRINPRDDEIPDTLGYSIKDGALNGLRKIL